MSHLENATKAIEAHEALVARALKIVDGVPFWAAIYNDVASDNATVTIDGDTAILWWPEAESEWDSCRLEQQSATFPARLLFISDADLAKWKDDERKAYDAEQARKRQAETEAAVANEHRIFLALKAKYEPSTPA